MRKMANVFTLYVSALIVMAFGAFCFFVIAFGVIILSPKDIVPILEELRNDMGLRKIWKTFTS